MLACVDGMSEECQEILNKMNSKSGPVVGDEDWAYGQGYYLVWRAACKQFIRMHACRFHASARTPCPCRPTLLTPGGALQDNFGDIDDGADIGLVDMPYPLGDDLLQSHMASISGVKPCGACDE